MASSTRSRRFLRTWALLLMTAETVKIETPDSRATSEILAAFFAVFDPFFLGGAMAIASRYQDWLASPTTNVRSRPAFMPHPGQGSSRPAQCRPDRGRPQ